jgi:folate-dependent phosphoribosylglycinamide formyltransferase PurN
MTNQPLVVFAYAFPHRKTHDFLSWLFLEGERDVVVLGAPFQKLKTKQTKVTHHSKIMHQPAVSTEALCKKFDMAYYEVLHNDADQIRKIIQYHGARTAVISGARILKPEIIDMFKDGVINFHPGPIPETSGLDCLFYTIKKGVTPSVTVHYIDGRVDAGDLIKFFPLLLNPADTFEIVQENIYQVQLCALREIIGRMRDKRLETTPLERPYKNKPLSAEEKEDVLRSFPQWRDKLCKEQRKAYILSLVEEGSLEGIKALSLTENEINETLNSRGWTPLSVAVFQQHVDLARYLLDNGADVNYANSNGTTILMYAKTKLLHTDDNYDFMKFLINHGADVTAKDLHGKTVLDYVREKEDTRMEQFLGGFMEVEK